MESGVITVSRISINEEAEMRRVRSLVCLLAVTCLIAGCSASKSDDDGLPAAGISANFAASPQWGSAPLTVQFTDTSTSTQGIATWLWDFGDGQTSAERHPMHGYTAEGSYDVSLTVTGPEGSDTEIKAGFITVTLASDGSKIPLISPWIMFTLLYLIVSSLLLVLAVRRMRRMRLD